MEDTISLTVKLRGGEALYITPVSYDWSGEDNKFHIYPTIEFLPNIPSVLKRNSYNYKPPIYQLWYSKITRTTKAFLGTISDNIQKLTGSNVFHPRFKDWTWDWGFYYLDREINNDWFYAVEVFQSNEPLHLRGNIEVDWSNASKYITRDIGYLSPSSLWIEERLEEEFHVWTFDKKEDTVAEEKFWKWRQEQVDKGYEVFYITSLET